MGKGSTEKKLLNIQLKWSKNLTFRRVQKYLNQYQYNIFKTLLFWNKEIMLHCFISSLDLNNVFSNWNIVLYCIILKTKLYKYLLWNDMSKV